MKEISIKYNDIEIATLTAGQGITLSCGRTKLESDIVIESTGATAIVKYKNKTIATLAEGESVTLYCKDQIAQADIVVWNTSIPEEGGDVTVPEGEEYVVSGTWCFNGTPTYRPLTEEVSFTIYGGTDVYEGIKVDKGGYHTTVKYISSDVVFDYAFRVEEWGGWQCGYDIITFTKPQTVSKEFYEWLTENATPKLISFSIGGTTYQAQEGMTWGEWVESEYNVPQDDGGLLIDWDILEDGGWYYGERSNVPIGVICRGSHGGGNIGYAVMRNGNFAMSNDTIEAVAYGVVSIANP